ncbi:MAG TPA: hypothetical protein VI757_13935 [Bacteroidia bacterium]|nr:hypothetical protein [Bacteroidia bacterium]
MALQITQIRPAYACSQDELYATSILIVDSFKINQAFFQTKKTIYTILFGNNLRAEILAAKALPDFQQRGASQETFKVQLEQAADDCLIIWQELDSFIKSAFAQELIKTKREEAGSTHYKKASRHDWESVSQLMLSGSTFITNYTAELNTGGMTPTFPTDFDSNKTNFDNLYLLFKGAEQTSSEKRNEKINANNTFHKKITLLCEDGQKYYRTDPAKRERFTFSRVLELVSGSGTETITVDIAPSATVSFDKVIANSPIINSGTVSFIVCQGTAACNPATSPVVSPGDQLTNTFGPVLSLTNQSATLPAKATIRIVRA